MTTVPSTSSSAVQTEATQQTSGKKAVLDLVVNILLPSLILDKGNRYLGEVPSLILACSLPLTYGLWEAIQTKKINFISALGLVSILMTGTINLMGKSWVWTAWKEALQAMIFGAFLLVSHATSRPFIKTMFFQPQLINFKILNRALENPESEKAMDKALWNTSLMMFLTTMLSAVANFFFAKYFLEGITPKTEEFNQGLSRMNLLSLPVIGIPMTVVMMVLFFKYLLPKLAQLCGCEVADLTSEGETVRRTVRAKDLDPLDS